MILVIVLWTIAMMTIVVVALATYAQRSLSLAAIETSRLRTEMAIKSGVNAAGAMILATPAKQRLFADGTPVQVDLGATRVTEIAIRDATGLVDLNRAEAPLLAGLFTRVAESEADPEKFAEQLVAWRNKHGGKKPEDDTQDASATRQDDANEADQNEQQNDLPTVPPPFFSTAQLYATGVADTPAIDRLMPYVALYSHGGRVNPMAAPEPVLRSVPEIAPADIALLRDAQSRRNADTPAVQAVISKYEDFLTLAESSVYLVEIRIAAGDGLIVGSRVRATIVLDAEGEAPYRVLAWSW
jgi:type II secretory pathway component PulK